MGIRRLFVLPYPSFYKETVRIVHMGVYTIETTTQDSYG